jgi:hypothetical protein
MGDFAQFAKNPEVTHNPIDRFGSIGISETLPKGDRQC